VSCFPALRMHKRVGLTHTVRRAHGQASFCFAVLCFAVRCVIVKQSGGMKPWHPGASIVTRRSGGAAGVRSS